MAMPRVGIIASGNGKQPDAPVIGTATAGAGNASVAFTESVYKGKANSISFYTALSSPGGFSAAGYSSPIVVTSLTAGTAYTFTVTATATSAGISVTSPASAASNSVTPTAAALKRCTSFQISIGCCTSTSQCGPLGAGASCSPETPGAFTPINCE
jgi:hypothetical protein